MRADALRRNRPDSDDGLGRAIALAVGVHLLLALLLWLGAFITWDRTPLQAAGGPSIEATLEVSDLDAVRRALAFEPEPLPEPLPEPEEVVPPPPQPLPEPRPQDAPTPQQAQPQERVPEPSPVDQDEVRRDAERERARIAREQEEKRRQEQIELERQHQEQAEQQRRLAQQQQQREEQRKREEAEKKLAQIRAEREKLEREARLREQRLQQIADRQKQQEAPGPASPVAQGSEGTDDGLAARYAAAIQEAITRNWTRPDNVPLGQRCRLYITQLPGGEVNTVEFDPGCPYDALGRRSVEAAVRKAAPLPYRGFESVFSRRLNLNFTAQDR